MARSTSSHRTHHENRMGGARDIRVEGIPVNPFSRARFSTHEQADAGLLLRCRARSAIYMVLWLSPTQQTNEAVLSETLLSHPEQSSMDVAGADPYQGDFHVW